MLCYVSKNERISAPQWTIRAEGKKVEESKTLTRGSNPGSNPFFSRTGELFFALPLEKRIPAPRSGALENFRPQNRVFTPHFLSKITSIRVVYGVNRNLLIEISPLVPLD